MLLRGVVRTERLGGVVVTAAHVLVLDGQGKLFALDAVRHLVEVVAKDRDDASSSWRADPKGASTCGFDPLLGVAFRVADERQTGAVALLGMRSVGDDALDDASGVGSQLGGPLDDALWRPGAPLPMRFRPMCFVGGEASFRPVVARMARNSPAVEEDFDAGRRRTDEDMSPDKVVRRAVVPALKLDVVVDVNLRLLPGRRLETTWWERAECGLVDALELAATTALELLEGPVVEFLEQLGDRRVQVFEREERGVPKSCEDPSLCDLHGDLDLGLVLRPAGPRRNDRGAVVLSELREHRVDLGIEAVRPRDRTAKLVRHGDLRNPAEVLERARGRGDEVVALLRPRGLGEREAARAHRGDVELDLDDLAAGSIDDARSEAGVVEERLLTSSMVLTHRSIDAALELPIAIAELAVLIGPARLRVVGGSVAVLDPEKLKRHSAATHLAMDPSEIDRNAAVRRVPPGLLE